MRGFKVRLARLEGRNEEGRQMGTVIWLGLDGQPEHAPEASDRRIIYLPRKAPSAEAWEAWIRDRGLWPPSDDGGEAA